MRHSDNLVDLAAALVKVQSTVLKAIKDTENPFFKRKYASFEGCWDVLRDPLAENGFCIVQGGDGSTLSTMLIHSSGQWIESTFPLGDKTTNAQEIMAAISYLRRGGLAAITGLVQVDDDGESLRKTSAQFKAEMLAAKTMNEAKAIWETMPQAMTVSAEMVAFKEDLKRRFL